MLFRRLFFTFSYFKKPPWESGIVPPEVTSFIQNHPVGRALDLGCGSGTSCLALARAGWHVTGVDFVPAALRQAEQKFKTAGLEADFLLSDVTRLPPSLFDQSFNLVLDVGCFHTLSEIHRQAYFANLLRLLSPGGAWLIYGFLSGQVRSGVGISEQDIRHACELMALVDRQNGLEKGRQPSTWLTFLKE